MLWRSPTIPAPNHLSLSTPPEIEREGENKTKKNSDIQ
jgi:hypothetical protein